MNRRHTAGEYLEVVERFRRVRQDIAFSSDFIVGFPGETGEDFAATLALVTQIGYAAAYSFKYSPRPGTPAADMRETVSAAEMDERLVRLQELIDSQQSAFNAAAIGSTVDVLFERAARGGLAHPQFHFFVWKIENAERQRRIADRLAVKRDARICNGIAGALVQESGLDLIAAADLTDAAKKVVAAARK